VRAPVLVEPTPSVGADRNAEQPPKRGHPRPFRNVLRNRELSTGHKRGARPKVPPRHRNDGSRPAGPGRTPRSLQQNGRRLIRTEPTLSTHASTVQSCGAPRAAYADDSFVIIREEAVRALGSWEAAGVFQRIAWRCERQPGNEWRATIEEIQDEVWLSRHKTRKALDHLRAVGWVSSRPTSVLDSTQKWSVVWESDMTPPEAETPHPGDELQHTPIRNSAPKDEEIPHSSYKTEDNYKTKTHSADAEQRESFDQIEATGDIDAANRLCDLLASELRKGGATAPVTAAWRAAAVQLLETHREIDIARVIRFAAGDSFWASRTARMPLILKHYDALCAADSTRPRAYSDAEMWGDVEPTPPMTEEEVANLWGPSCPPVASDDAQEVREPADVVRMPRRCRHSQTMPHGPDVMGCAH
jgi:hypothetical protein